MVYIFQILTESWEKLLDIILLKMNFHSRFVFELYLMVIVVAYNDLSVNENSEICQICHLNIILYPCKQQYFPRWPRQAVPKFQNLLMVQKSTYGQENVMEIGTVVKTVYVSNVRVGL